MPKTVNFTCIVRVTISSWLDGRSLHYKKSLTTLKRKSSGYGLILLEEEDLHSDPDLIKRIINFNEVDEGIYELKVINEWREPEWGIVEDYDLILEPYEVIEEEKSNE